MRVHPHTADAPCLGSYTPRAVLGVGCANGGVLIGAVMPFGKPASDTFRSLVPLYTRAGQAVAGDNFVCVTPDTTALHAKYFVYGGKPMANFIRVAASMLTETMPHVAALNRVACPARADFEPRVYDSMRSARLSLSVVAGANSLKPEDIPTAFQPPLAMRSRPRRRRAVRRRRRPTTPTSSSASTTSSATPGRK